MLSKYEKHMLRKHEFTLVLSFCENWTLNIKANQMDDFGFRWHYQLKEKPASVTPVSSRSTVDQDTVIGGAGVRGQRLPGGR